MKFYVKVCLVLLILYHYINNIIFVAPIITYIYVIYLLYNLTVSLLSTETDRFDVVNKLNLLNSDEQLLGLI